jgi:hypothetical protein
MSTPVSANRQHIPVQVAPRAGVRITGAFSRFNSNLSSTTVVDVAPWEIELVYNDRLTHPSKLKLTIVKEKFT